jgi:glycerate kinase
LPSPAGDAPRIVIAPDKFKGSLSASEAASAIERGVRRAAPAASCAAIPMADGGEGTVDAFVEAGWKRVLCSVHGPLGDPVQAAFALRNDAAVIEMASASGLGLLRPERYAPRVTTTFGSGELLRAALDSGARNILFAIGGSATTDGGAGFLQALGVRLLDEAGNDLPAGGAALQRLARIDAGGLDPRLREATIEAAADVDNPLLGPRGSSAVFGPQKGATPEDVRVLDSALERFADVVAATWHSDPRNEPGVGAAGGLGFTLRAVFGASVQPGAPLVAELRGLAAALAGANWCFTGEGRIDRQTLGGKVIDGVAALARQARVPTIAFTGSIEAGAAGALAARGVACIAIAEESLARESAMRDAAALLERAVERELRRLLACERPGRP